MSDLISREEAVRALGDAHFKNYGNAIMVIQSLPSAQLEVKNILYPDCANALLMMWLDEVLTDDEYNRIMDKLNEYEKKNGNAMRG